MGFLSTIGKMASAMMVGVSQQAQASDVVRAINSLQEELNAVARVANGESTVKIMRVLAKQLANGMYPKQSLTGQMYQIYRKDFISNLPSGLRNIENQQFLGSIVAMLQNMQTDLTVITRNSMTLLSFGGAEQLRLSHAYILGYLKMVQMSIDLLTAATFLINSQPGDATPMYHLRNVQRYSHDVALFIAQLENRGRRSIIDVIQDVRDKQRDTLLVNNGLDIGDYGRESDYDQQFLRTSANGLTINPFLLIGNIFIKHARARHDRRVLDREFYAAKIQVLAMQLNNVSPDDPEYVRVKAILDKYTESLSLVDAQIAEYEHV